jgi:hypothetical protein
VDGRACGGGIATKERSAEIAEIVPCISLPNYWWTAITDTLAVHILHPPVAHAGSLRNS